MSEAKQKSRDHFWIVLAVAAAFFIIAMLAVSFLHKMEDMVEEEISLNLQEIADSGVSLIQERIHGSLDKLSTLAELAGEEGHSLTSPDILNFLNKQAKNAKLEEVTVVTLNDWIHRRFPELTGLNCFSSAVSGNPAVSGLMDSENGDKKVMVMAVPIYQGGELAGVLTARYYTDEIKRLLSVPIFQGNGYCYIAHSTGEILLNSDHPRSDKNFTNIATDFTNSRLQDRNGIPTMMKNMSEGKAGELFYQWDGTERIMNYTPIGTNDWYLLSVLPRDVVTSRTDFLFHQVVYLMCAVLTVFTLLTAYLFTLQRKSQIRLKQAHEELTSIYNTIPGGVFQCRLDEDWSILSANEGFYQYLGYSKAEFAQKCGNALSKIIEPQDWERLQQNMKKQLEKEEELENENRFICADGTARWVWVSSKPVKEKDGTISLYCTFLDISQLHEAQEGLLLSQRRYEIVMSQTQDTIFEWKLADGTVYHSHNYRLKFGRDPITEHFPQSVVDAGRVEHEDEQEFLEIFKRILNGERYSEGECRMKKANGQAIWCRIGATAIRDEQGRLDRVVGVMSDIDSQKRKLQQVEETARQDSLTHIYNKGTTESLIQDYISRGNQPAVLMMIDVDDFKRVNDTLGHLYGDAVLGETAKALRSLFRTTDVVGRIGGDEFVVLMTHVKDERSFREKAQAISDVFRRTYRKGALGCSVSCSIGIVHFPKDAESYEGLLKKADIALYYAKRHGKNQYAIYTEQMSREGILSDGEEGHK